MCQTRCGLAAPEPNQGLKSRVPGNENGRNNGTRTNFELFELILRVFLVVFAKTCKMA